MIYTTNVAPAGTSINLLLTNRANVKMVFLSSVTTNVLVEFFNQNSIANPWFGTNYSTNTTYVSRASYTTNMAVNWTNFDGAISIWTNQGIFTYNVTNTGPITNASKPLMSFVVSPNNVGVYPVDALFDKGVCMRVSGNVNVVMNYNLGQ